MAKITSKYQVTVPKAVADRYSLRPGDEIEWIASGDTIRVTPRGVQKVSEDPLERVRLFDQATERHCSRLSVEEKRPTRDRGWTREDLYDRGRSH